MQEYADNSNEKVSEKHQSVSIAFDNHYAGFGRLYLIFFWYW